MWLFHYSNSIANSIWLLGQLCTLTGVFYSCLATCCLFIHILVSLETSFLYLDWLSNVLIISLVNTFTRVSHSRVYDIFLWYIHFTVNVKVIYHLMNTKIYVLLDINKGCLLFTFLYSIFRFDPFTWQSTQ